MDEKKFQQLMQQKIKEFLEYGKELGFFNQSNASRLKEKVQRIRFVQNNSIPGDAHTGFNSGITTITVNTNRIFAKEDWFVDEVLFHELTHSVSGLTENEFETYYSWCIDENIQKFMTEEEKQSFKEYSQKRPFQYSAGYGVALLDDFVAQYMSQSMVQKKYEKDPRYKDGIYKMESQKTRSYCPELHFYSSFNDYSIYEGFGKKFVEALYGKEDMQRFCVESMQPNIIDNILLTYQKRKGGLENIYKIFMYLGTIDFAENVELNHFGPDTLSQDPHKVTQNPVVMKMVINKAQEILSYEKNRAKMLSEFGNR
mgnify:CR=1 FL=1